MIERLSACEDDLGAVKTQVAVLDKTMEKAQESIKQIPHLNKELTKHINLSLRRPTGHVKTIELENGNKHKYNAYYAPDGLNRPHKHYEGQPFGDRWVDLDEPLD